MKLGDINDINNTMHHFNWSEFWKSLKTGFAPWLQGVQTLKDDLTGNSAIATQYGYQSQLQDDQQAFNSAEAEKDRQFQETMANTQYQRAVADLRAAGLNPWLAVNGMNGASPSGASATSSAGSVGQPQSGAQTLSSLATTAVSAALIAKIVAKLVA